MPFNLEKVLDFVISLVIALLKIIKLAIIATARKTIIKKDKWILFKEKDFVFIKSIINVEDKNKKNNKEMKRDNMLLFEPEKNTIYKDKIMTKKDNIRNIPLKAKKTPKISGTTIAT
jgi:hypothetical protein